MQSEKPQLCVKLMLNVCEMFANRMTSAEVDFQSFYPGVLESKVNLELAIDEYLVFLKVKKCHANTLDAYSRDLSNLLNGLENAHELEISDVTTELLSGWLQGLSRQGFALRSQARMLVTVRGLFRFLMQGKISKGRSCGCFSDASPSKNFCRRYSILKKFRH